MPLQSFIEISPDSHFPLENLPYGVFTPQAGGAPRVGVAVGDFVLDLSVLESENLLHSAHFTGHDIFNQTNLNTFMALGKNAWKDVREALQALLSADNAALRDNEDLRKAALHPMDAVTLHLPVNIGDYTDFYSSKDHAVNVGRILRGDEGDALFPNWLHLPVAYHGRASSVILSGVDIHRPQGQTKSDSDYAPRFAASRFMDFELEMGFFVGTGNTLGEPIDIAAAKDHIFGMVLLNDWSARDIQKWEYQPLGPFLAKNLATSISPWVVTLEALEPFRCAGPTQNPQPLPYLQHENHRTYDIHLEVHLQSKHMHERKRIATSNFKYLYWDVSQQLTHHTITGCNMRTGDLCGSGTISGPGENERGSMLELTWGGRQPLELPDGSTRRALEDGDTVMMTGWCQGEGYRVGFGEVKTTLLPAKNGN